MDNPREKPNRMGPEAYLVMRGWCMYVIEEAAAERRRLREAGDMGGFCEYKDLLERFAE